MDVVVTNIENPMGPFFLVEYETHIGRDVLLTLHPDTNGDHLTSSGSVFLMLVRPNLFMCQRIVLDDSDALV